MESQHYVPELITDAPQVGLAEGEIAILGKPNPVMNAAAARDLARQLMKAARTLDGSSDPPAHVLTTDPTDRPRRRILGIRPVKSSDR